jgi:2-phosphosulfolactate phosphatase
MRVDVLFGPNNLPPALIAGRVVAVIDVLRASTTIAVALAHGAKAVVPLDSADEAITRAKAFERSDVRLAGERKMLPIPGFDFGNSPTEFTPEAVEGKTVLFTTTNGTAALVAVQGARDVVVASYVNFTVIAALLRSALRGGTNVSIVCAGRERQFSLEDAACAGRYARQISRRLSHVDGNDAARACMLLDKRYGDRLLDMFGDAEHGKALAEAGFSEDLSICAELDSYPIVPVYEERQITKLGPDRAR